MRSTAPPGLKKGLAIKSHESIKNRGVFLKTRMCAYFQSGKCLHGGDCEYAHAPNEIRTHPDLRKTTLCDGFSKGTCKLLAADCKYAHGVKDLRATPEVFKTSLCRFWQTGKCAMGKGCRHAHGEDEISGATAVSTAAGSPVGTTCADLSPRKLLSEGAELVLCESGIVGSAPGCSPIPSPATTVPPSPTNFRSPSLTDPSEILEGLNLISQLLVHLQPNKSESTLMQDPALMKQAISFLESLRNTPEIPSVMTPSPVGSPRGD